MTTVLLALASAVSWGFSDFFGGILSRRMHTSTVLFISQGWGLVAITIVFVTTGTALPATETLVQGGLAGLVGASGIAAFYRALAIGMVSLVAPIAATGVAVPVVVGLLRGEEVSAFAMVGIGAASLGIILASVAPSSHAVSITPTATDRSIPLAIIAAIGFGAFFTLFADASRGGLIGASLAQRTTSVVLLGTAWLIIRARRDPTTTPVPWPQPLRMGIGLALTGVLDIAANVLFGLASTTGLLSIAAVISSLYPIVTVLLARVVLRERLGRLQQLGTILALSGAGLIGLR